MMKKRRPPMPKPRHPVSAAGVRPAGIVAQANGARLMAAFTMHQQGRLDQAEKLYKEILQSEPQHFDALQLLARIALQRKNFAVAVELFDRALRVKPHHPDLLSNRGNALLGLKRHAEALESYELALRIQPEYADALYNRGNVLRELKRHEEALESYDRALRITSDDADTLYNRGNALFALKRHAEALDSYDRSLKLKPDYAEALYNRGNALLELKRPEEALASCDRALKFRPNEVDALINRGNALLKLQRPAEALASCDRVLRLKPDHADALSNRGNALLELKRPEEALVSCARALKRKPDHAEALINRGNALMALGRPKEALASYDCALKIQPDYAEALGNRGNALLALGRPEEALASYDRALKLRPDDADVHWNESLCRLLLGEFALGWRKYEWRWKNKPLTRNFTPPLWVGEAPLAGKTLLLHSEQGFGDTLQFCRYAPLAAAQGARVVLEVPSALKALCQTLAGVDTLLAIGEPLPPFDFHTPLMSLPLAFGTRLDSIPAEVPYLHADPQKLAAWQVLLGQRGKPRVGLAWSGRPAHKNDHNRSLPFAQLAELLDDTAEFICLQKEFRKEDETLVRRHAKMRVFSEQLQDFADTAALIESLDLVITVDTSVAHLAGALGKAVWILLPFAPDWRWLLEREDSPWYPSVRLFRQRQLGQWAPLLAEVRQALHEI